MYIRKWFRSFVCLLFAVREYTACTKYLLNVKSELWFGICPSFGVELTRLVFAKLSIEVSTRRFECMLKGIVAGVFSR